MSLELVRGSHLWNVTYSPLPDRDPEADPSAQAQLGSASEPMLGAETYADWTYWSGVKGKTLPPDSDIEAERDSFDILGWDYESGDVILFHEHILHSALGDAESPVPRRAHASLWFGRDAYYLHRIGQVIPDPIELYRHKPETGQLLNGFPEVFPLGWSPDIA